MSGEEKLDLMCVLLMMVSNYDIILKNIKLEGKNRCDVKDFINGIKKENFIGGIFNE